MVIFDHFDCMKSYVIAIVMTSAEFKRWSGGSTSFCLLDYSRKPARGTTLRFVPANDMTAIDDGWPILNLDLGWRALFKKATLLPNLVSLNH
jgi:hypothetical protein